MSVPENMMNMMQKQQEYKLFVGDLDENCNETILKKNFEMYGAKSAVVNKARRKRYPSETQERYYGVVSLPSMEDCERAKNEMDQKVIMHNRIRVCIYRSYFDRINSDIFFKGTGSSQPQEIKQAFSQFGQVFSVKVAQEKNGQQLNYGYLSFYDKESRDKCITSLKDSCVDIKGNKVEVSQFLPFNQREKNYTNIYLKNLSGKSEETIKTMLTNEATKHGDILSMMVKYDERHQKYFAFICYKNTECAKNAYNQLQTLEIDGQKVEINWAMKKQERQQVILQNFKMNIKKTNVFVKNLLETVDDDSLKQVFSQFGNVTSAAVRLPINTPSTVQTKTKFGFINFQTEQMAQLAIQSTQNQNTLSEDIKSLFVDGNPSICFHKSKEQMNKQKTQKNSFNNQNIMQMFQQINNPQMFIQSLQQMMFMNMNMNMNNFKNPKQNYQRNNMNMMNMSKMPMQGGMMAGMSRQMPQMMMPQLGMQQFVMPQMPGMSQMPMYSNTMSTNKVQLNQNVQQKLSPPEQQMTAQQLKENLNEFLKYDQDKQRSLLGSLLFPVVEKQSGDASLAPKITGMLIDFDVFEVSEILEFLENADLLKERIKEAEELINNSDSK